MESLTTILKAPDENKNTGQKSSGGGLNLGVEDYLEV
jgi:hypothetical protein